MDEVSNATALTRIFGRWPSFHDAEVVRVILDREPASGPSLLAMIHVFEMTSEVDPAGFYVLKHHTLVTLRFEDILLENLKWFNNQNVLWDLEIIPVDPDANEGRGLRVEMPSSHGLEAAFLCRRAVVDAVEPFTPKA
jgi:hypothetical protein